jgi:hypothetical protein
MRINPVIETFQKILEKYKFIESIPESVLENLSASRFKILKETLKANNSYSLWYGLVIRQYFALKNIGLSLSLILIKTLIVIESLILIGGGIIFYSYQGSLKKEIQNPLKKDTLFKKKKKQSHISPDKLIPKKNLPVKQKKAVFINRIGIQPLEDRNVGSQVTRNISLQLYREIARIKGYKKVQYLGKGMRQKNVKRMVVGSIFKLGEQTTIAIKIVNVQDSKVIWSTRKSFIDNNKDLVLYNIGKNVARFIE